MTKTKKGEPVKGIKIILLLVLHMTGGGEHIELPHREIELPHATASAISA